MTLILRYQDYQVRVRSTNSELFIIAEPIQEKLKFTQTTYMYLAFYNNSTIPIQLKSAFLTTVDNWFKYIEIKKQKAFEVNKNLIKQYEKASLNKIQQKQQQKYDIPIFFNIQVYEFLQISPLKLIGTKKLYSRQIKLLETLQQKQSHINYVESIIENMRNQINYHKDQNQSLKNENQYIKDENSYLKNENSNLKDQNFNLKHENSNLKNVIIKQRYKLSRVQQILQDQNNYKCHQKHNVSQNHLNSQGHSHYEIHYTMQNRNHHQNYQNHNNYQNNNHHQHQNNNEIGQNHQIQIPNFDQYVQNLQDPQYKISQQSLQINQDNQNSLSLQNENLQDEQFIKSDSKKCSTKKISKQKQQRKQRPSHKKRKEKKKRKIPKKVKYHMQQENVRNFVNNYAKISKVEQIYDQKDYIAKKKMLQTYLNWRKQQKIQFQYQQQKVIQCILTTQIKSVYNCITTVTHYLGLIFTQNIIRQDIVDTINRNEQKHYTCMKDQKNPQQNDQEHIKNQFEQKQNKKYNQYKQEIQYKQDKQYKQDNQQRQSKHDEQYGQNKQDKQNKQDNKKNQQDKQDKLNKQNQQFKHNNQYIYNLQVKQDIKIGDIQILDQINYVKWQQK